MPSPRLILSGAFLAAWLHAPVVHADDTPAKPATKTSADKSKPAAIPEALKTQVLELNELTTLDLMNARLRKLSKEPAKAKELVRAAATMQAAGGKSAPLKFNAAIVLGKLALNVHDYVSAQTLYEWCFEQAYKAKSSDKLNLSFGGLADALFGRKRYDVAEEAAQRVLDTETWEGSRNANRNMTSAKIAAMETLIRAKAKQGDVDAALERVDQLIKIDRDGFEFYPLRATVLRDANRHDEVITTYQDMLKRVDQSKLLDDDRKDAVGRQVRYFMTASYMDNKQTDKAIEMLRDLVKEDPENASYANDLGFILADNDKELDQAEKLIRSAIKLDEEAQKKRREDAEEPVAEEEPITPNAAYLDSLGWVLYKKKQYPEALKFLKQAVNDIDEANSLEIWDHVADAQAALGNKAEAIATWEKALKQEDQSPRDPDRRKAIQAKLKKAKGDK